MLGILYIAALIGNLFPLPGCPHGQLLLAGIPVLMIVRLYGTGWGTLAALLTPLFALSFGNMAPQEWLWVIEAVFIGAFLRHGVKNLFTASLLFWGLLAWPIQYLQYGLQLQYPTFAMIQAIGWTTFNGLGNAAIASMLLHFLRRKNIHSHSTFCYLETEINAVAAAFLLPGVVILAMNIQGPQDFMRPGLEHEVTTRCRAMQKRLNVFHANLASKLAGLTRASAQNESLETRLNRLLQQEKSVQRVLIWDTKGKLLLSSTAAAYRPRSPDPLRSLAVDKIQTLALEKKPTVFALSGPSAGAVPMLCLGQPLAKDNRAIGFVLASIDPQSYIGILTTDRKERPAALLVDGSNRVAVSTSPAWHVSDPLTATLFDPASAFDLLLAWDPEASRVSRLWPQRVGEPTERRQTPLRMVITLPGALLRHHLHRMLLGSMSLMLLPCLIAVAMAWRVHKRIIKPIKKLSETTRDLPERLRNGVAPAWPSAPITEVSDLSRYCQQAAQALATSYTELEKQRRHNTDTLDNLLAKHRWESFTSSRQLEKTARQLAKEKHQRLRVQELIDNIDAAESRYQLLIENSLVGIFVYQHHRYTYVNPRFAEIFGYTPEEIVDSAPQPQLVHPDDQLFVDANNLKILGGVNANHLRYEFVGLRKTGQPIDVEILIGRGISEGQPALIGSLLDITERKEAEKTIEHLAFHDPLTGLANRLLFMDRIEQAIAHAHRHHESFALMFLDLDRFKTINDSLGHSAGDAALKEVAQRLTTCLRETDTVSRFGGDEFNVLLSGPSHEEEIELIAHKILKSLAWPYDINDHEVFMTCSIGIASYPKDGREAITLVKNADTALYRAKDLGRNNFQFYSSSMNARALERMAMESSLRRMFERQELRVHYQPQVGLQSGRITGLEGLVRWEHPVGNMIAPSVFVPLAEETGLIVPMGEWVLQAGCYQLKTWLDAGFAPMRLGINVSAHQLQKSDFAELVMQVLKECDLPPHYLNLEITETVIMHNMNEAFETLRRLRAVGITISIDDFGTGFSSLSYLKDLPADHLKIDRAFVQNLPFGNNEANIARHIIEMAHGLNLKVIAEGVENQAQLDFLREAGCDEIQGFLVSRPLAAEDITEILTNDEMLLNFEEDKTCGKDKTGWENCAG
ncbi:sensor diguanylate cyclase/phosphodiesterase, PAS domain-containing [Syntrophotalea carbinolica DSM 2380]|uniref:Sensor diguanylate cyclase/phosphodiesterase, PAS domain-containing n=1 Tax=Syntrophotalea carbinolica (strain DSM 2380 / NBRC 103641 / GraBd1) TaxID=338963 RepID=Q3A0D5_SYNC1|nr:EAL domain-containing protein [Syntrophotalea carbinolica]ABA90172.1 sensor diguanylate cyclase/phosphodiesterase, PAS domain-containing [Syntrophotalea carbinolica DSM 2380]